MIILLVLIGLFFLIAAFLPNNLQMESSRVIDKPASLLFKQVNNFHNWPAWSPWQESDPAQVNTYEGASLGVGAKTLWTSEKNGSGSMTITESVPYSRVASDLDFGQKGLATNAFVFEESPGGTKVTWSVNIPELGYPIGRYIGLMMPGMMKTYFEKGLENLENVTKEMPEPSLIEITDLPEMKVLSITDSCSWDDIEMKMGELYTELMITISKNKKVSVSGYPFAAFMKWDEVNRTTTFEAGMPVEGEAASVGRVVYKTLHPTRAVCGTHFGAYDKTEYLYRAMDEYVLEHGLLTVGGPMEMYVTDPTMEPDTSKWQSNVYFPVK